MGMINGLFGFLFGNGRNMVAETAEVFRENAEAGAQRGAALQAGAIGQLAAEFTIERKGRFDRFIDGLNRLPRPLMVFSVLSLFASAMFSPVWFGIRMQGLALVPQPLWWLMGAIVSFYFGARAQTQLENARQTMAQTMAQVPQLIENIEHLRELDADSPGAATTGEDAELTLATLSGPIDRPETDNPAIRAWRERQAA